MSTDSIAATLRAARDLIADPSHWTQHSFGRDENGNSNWSNAIKFCAIGAMMKVDGPFEVKAQTTLEKAARRLFNRGPIGVNDHDGHEAVLRMFDEAIAEAERTNGAA